MSDPTFRTTSIQALAHTMVDQSRRELDLDDDDELPTSTSGPRDASAPPEQPLPEIDDVVGGHYRLLRLLGEGMFGKVYVAHRLDVPEHHVAIKLLKRSMYAGRNVERELVMLATVGHPHVVQLKDHGATPDFVWLTMPVYQGETLAERLLRGPLPMREAYEVFLAVAHGLEALHAAGLRHQDVKPENVFLARFGNIVHPILLDLGVAAEIDSVFVAGTVLYAAPEQVAALGGVPGSLLLSAKMDTYCLATTLLMALVGPQHFPGEHANDRDELARAQDTRATRPLEADALPDLDEVPRTALEAAFRRWLAIDPDERPTMTELAAELDVLREQEREEVRAEKRKRARQRIAFQRVRIALGAMVLVGFAGGALVYSKRETLRMANELAQAKREGAKSFDKLDTCTAAHRLAANEASRCKTTRDKESTEFRATLDNTMKTGAAADAERTREIRDYSFKLKKCEDTALAAAKKAETDKEKATADWTKARTELETERDKQKALAEQRSTALKEVEGERETCKAERNACFDERDTLRGGKPASTAAPNTNAVATPATSGSVSPAAEPAVPTASAPPAASAPRAAAPAAPPGSATP